jgi:hypothetical protein
MQRHARAVGYNPSATAAAMASQASWDRPRGGRSRSVRRSRACARRAR